MPRGPRLDYPGALQHVIARGIERREIFRTDDDRLDLLDRLAELVTESNAALYAWVLMPNHIHALLRTGNLSLSRFMQRLLGPYACAFNRRHKRAGHLFQNRFKNTLVEEEPYLLELVRYLHLNPVRSQLPVSLASLDEYPWTGHAVLLGKLEFAAQETDFVLGHFGDQVGAARSAYRSFVREGMLRGTEVDLEGGGLRRSAGGWEFVPKLRRGRESWAFDERILGSTEFVVDVLGRLQEGELDTTGSSTVNGFAFHPLFERVAQYYGVSCEEIASRTVRRDILRARSLLCLLAVRHCGLTAAEVARKLGISANSVGRAIRRADRTCCPAEDMAKLLLG